MFLRSGCILFLVAVVTSELIQWKPCFSKGEGGKHCTLTNVAVEPCSEAARNEPCRIKKGKPASIAFDFQTDFDVESGLKSRAYWATVLADLPFVGMDTDACKNTKCPVQKNTVQHYNYSLDISKSFPSQLFDTKFKVWVDKEGPEKECCFMFKMKLT